jgi:ribosomal protein S18 acetylase RimI-like enzyme
MYKIERFDRLDNNFLNQCAFIFGEAFGYMFSKFSKDENKLGLCFANSFIKENVHALITENELIGFIAVANGKGRAMKIDSQKFKEEFGKIPGFIFSKQAKIIMEKPMCENENEIYIDYLAIAKKHRRKGYGKILLKYIHEMKCESFYIEVLENNYNAKRLYESFGYKIIKREHNFIMKLGKQPALLLMKK